MLAGWRGSRDGTDTLFDDSVQCLQADAAVEMERIHFYQASMEYVVLIQEVQERKKFEFVETVRRLKFNKSDVHFERHPISAAVRQYIFLKLVRFIFCCEQ